jgi:hypothetical protein
MSAYLSELEEVIVSSPDQIIGGSIKRQQGGPPDWATRPTENTQPAPAPKPAPEPGPSDDPLDHPVQVGAFTVYRGRQYLIGRPKKTWTIEGIAGPGDICTIYGASATGKTFAVLDLCFAAALGKPVWDTFNVARPLTVLYTTGEGGDGLGQRMIALEKKYGVSTPETFLMSPDVPQLLQFGVYYVADLAAHLETTIQGGLLPVPDIVVIDTLNNATRGGNDSDNADMKRAYDAIMLHLNRRFDCLTFVVHHTGRDETNFRGAYTLKSDSFSLIGFELKSGQIEVTCDKLKDADRWEPFSGRLTPFGPSVATTWNTRVHLNGPDKPDRERDIISYLTSAKEPLTQRAISVHITGKDYNTDVRLKLDELVGAGIVQTSPQNPARKLSGKNPSLYKLATRSFAGWE